MIQSKGRVFSIPGLKTYTGVLLSLIWATISLFESYSRGRAVATPRRILFRWTREFCISNFHILTPSLLVHVVTTWQCARRVFQHWKEGEKKMMCSSIMEERRHRPFLFKYLNTFVHDYSSKTEFKIIINDKSDSVAMFLWIQTDIERATICTCY